MIFEPLKKKKTQRKKLTGTVAIVIKAEKLYYRNTDISLRDPSTTRSLEINVMGIWTRIKSQTLMDRMGNDEIARKYIRGYKLERKNEIVILADYQNT